MKPNNNFSIVRVAQLVWRQLYSNGKYYLSFLGALSGGILTISILNTLAKDGVFSSDRLVVQMQAVAFVLGIILTSTSFKELSNKNRGWFYMMLPANPLEKLFANWFVTSIGYVLATSIALTITSLVISLLNSIFFTKMLFIFNPLTGNNLKLMLDYCIIHSIFFLGAVYFERHNLIKTLLSGFAVFIVILILGGITLKLLFFAGTIASVNAVPTEMQVFGSVEPIMKVAYYAILAPFFLTVSYFRLKEREV